MADQRNNAILVAVLSCLIGGGSGYLAARWQAPKPDLRARPRIAVVSYAAALKDKSADQVESTMADLDAKAKRLGASGFVVFNDNAIVAAPRGLQIPAESGDE